MGPVVNRLIGKFGVGVGMAAEYAENRRARNATFTPSASVAGDTVAGPSQTHPQDQPPTYTESVVSGNDAQIAAGSPPHGDNKIQLDDDLHDEESSELDDDDSDITLGDLVDEDEAAWYLDEYAASHEPPSYEDATNVPSEDDLVREIIAGQQAHAAQLDKGHLPCPVIIPQRRPRDKSRGFVKAYAPVLENVGIDQTTFLSFLKSLYKSSQASPWFTVIEVSSHAAHAAGPGIGFAIQAAVKVAVKAGRNVEVARKTNSYLDRMNEELFKPAGCFAFIMKYKTDTSMKENDGFFGVAAANVNLVTNQVVAKYGDGMAGLVNQMQMFRIAAGTTEGADELPASAPLIFPDVDNAVARAGKESFGQDTQAFMQDYLDRRAQIKFAREDSKSGLALPEEQRQMKSSLADPDHPMFNTGVVGLLTGGYVNVQGFVSSRREARGERRAARHEHRKQRKEEYHERKLDRHQRRVDRGVRRFEKKYGKSPSSTSLSTSLPTSETKPEASKTPREGRRRRRRGGVRGAVRKALNEDVLYLMIVNLPDEEVDDEPIGSVNISVN